MNKANENWKSIKVPMSLHQILKWMALQKSKYIYELIAELTYRELKGEQNESDTTNKK